MNKENFDASDGSGSSLRRARTILLIAYYFPPNQTSGAWRPYFLVKHLAALGWRSIVITIPEEDGCGDKSVTESDVPGMIAIRIGFANARKWLTKIGRTVWPKRKGIVATDSTRSAETDARSSLRRLLSDLIEENCLYPDDKVGWALKAALSGKRADAMYGCDVIYATGKPWSSLLVGAILKQILHKPLVVEFRDPWYDNPYDQRRFFWANMLDLMLEGWVIRRADRVVTLTKEMGEAMVSRHGDRIRDKLTPITNGYTVPSPVSTAHFPPSRPGNGTFSLIHAGELYGKRNVRPLLEALSDLICAGVIPLGKVKLDLLGADHLDDHKVDVLLQQPPLSEVVTVTPRVSFAECHKRLATSDLLLILQPDAPLQIPRKLFDYLAYGRPILAIASPGATASLMREEHLGKVVENHREEIGNALAAAYRSFVAGEMQGPTVEACALHTNMAVAGRVDTLLRETLEPHLSVP